MRFLGSTLIIAALATGCVAAEDAGDDGTGDDGTTDGGDDGSGDDGADDDGGDDGFRVVPLIDTEDGVQRVDVDTVTSIRCNDASHCAFGTYNFSDGGALFVTADGSTLTTVRTTEAQFQGIDDTGAGWIARLSQASPFFMATGDPTVAASWSSVEVGLNESDMDFEVLNSQELVRAGTGGDWLYVYEGVIWHAAQAPSATTEWTGLWSPHRVPPFPNDFEARKDADPTLCDSDPDNGFQPNLSDFGFASPDLGFVIYGAGRTSQISTDPPGVCVSRDGGATFHQVPFPGLMPDEGGPYAVQCIDASRCWAYGVEPFSGVPPYVYYSTNASAAAPIWQRAQVPGGDSDTPRDIAFASDGLHGWLVGENNLAWETVDGGVTWTDRGPETEALVGEVDLTSAFPIDAERVWLGGSRGVLLAR
jgi:hypothetical protein